MRGRAKGRGAAGAGRQPPPAWDPAGKVAERLARAAALREAGGPEAAASLIEALGDPSLRVRRLARRLLTSLTRRDYGLDSARWRAWWARSARLRCNRCRIPLMGRPLYYKAHLRLTSEPAELHILEEDAARDPAAEVERLSKALEGRSARELEDEVFVLLDFFLCLGCKKELVRGLRGGPCAGPS